MTLLIATEKGLFSDTRCINHGFVTKGDKTLKLEKAVYAAFSGEVPTEYPNRGLAKAAMDCVHAHSYLSTLREQRKFSGSFLNYIEPILSVLKSTAVGVLSNAGSPVMLAITKHHTYMIHTQKEHVRFTPKEVPWAFGSSGTLAKNLLQVYSDELDVYARCSKYDGMINLEVQFNDRKDLATPVPYRGLFRTIQQCVDKWDKEQVIGATCFLYLLQGIAKGKNGKPRKRFPNSREFADLNKKINEIAAQLEAHDTNVIKDKFNDLVRSK